MKASETPTPLTDAFAAKPGVNQQTWALLQDWADFARDLERQLSAARAELATARRDANELSMALQESVKLQSHYAALLNQYDGGNRKGFADATEWLERLRELSKPAIDGGKETVTRLDDFG